MPANGGEDVGKEKSLLLEGKYTVAATVEIYTELSLKKKKLLYFPAMLLLGINLRSLSQ